MCGNYLTPSDRGGEGVPKLLNLQDVIFKLVYEKGILKNFSKSNCAEVSLKKDTMTQVFSSEFCEVFKKKVLIKILQSF